MHGTQRWAGALLVVTAGLGGALAGAGPAHALTRDVEIRDSRYGGSARIDVGDTVRWTNFDDFTHTVTAEERDSGGNRFFDSGNLNGGESFSETFRRPGSYRYFCRQHPSMTGEVIVEGEAPVTTSSSITTTTTAPATTTTTAPTTTTTTTTERSAAGPPAAETAPGPGAGGDGNEPPSTSTTGSTPGIAPTTGPSSITGPSTTSASSSSSTSSTSSTTGPPATAPVAAGGIPLPPNVGPPGDGGGPSGASPEPADASETLRVAQAARAGERAPFDWATALSVTLMLAAGTFALWSLVRLRPGRTNP